MRWGPLLLCGWPGLPGLWYRGNTSSFLGGDWILDSVESGLGFEFPLALVVGRDLSVGRVADNFS